MSITKLNNNKSNFKSKVIRTVQVSLLSILTASASISALAADRDTTTEETRGAVVGGIIGAAVAGPIGLGVGAIVGGGLIGKLIGEQRIRNELSDELKVSHQARLIQGHKMSGELTKLNHRLAQMSALQAATKLELSLARQLPIQFKTNSSEIASHYKAQLNEYVKVLSAQSDAHVTLSGFADRRGEATYNQKLSEQRVTEVKQYLLQQGVKEHQILSQAFGESQPLTVEETVENHFFDRRVVMQLNGDAVASGDQTAYSTSTAER